MPTLPRRRAAQQEREWLQARRLRAAELFAAGLRQAEVARQLGQVAHVLLEGATANGFVGELWTLDRIAVVIERLTGVRHHPAHVWAVLRHRQPDRGAGPAAEVAGRRESHAAVEWALGPSQHRHASLAAQPATLAGDRAAACLRARRQPGRGAAARRPVGGRTRERNPGCSPGRRGCPAQGAMSRELVRLRGQVAASLPPCVARRATVGVATGPARCGRRRCRSARPWPAAPPG
jgi:hypothetical protein